jgi:hypothetical protein
MSATQIIAQIEQLPIEEREKVFRYVARQAVDANSRGGVDERFRKIADEIFTENQELFRKLAQ